MKYQRQEWSKLYDTHYWKKVREAKLLEEPYCRICHKTINLHIDHIFDHKGVAKLFYDYYNLQTLCLEHHGQKTMADDNLLLLKQTDWTLVINMKDTYNQYSSYLKHQEDIIKQMIKESSYNPYIITIGVGGMDMAQCKHLITEHIKRVKSKPQKIIYNQGVPNQWQELINHWLLNIPGVVQE